MRDFLTAELENRNAELQRLEAQYASLARRIEVLTAETNLLRNIIAKCDEKFGTESIVRAVREERRGKSRLSARWLPVMIAAVQKYPGAITFEQVPEIQRAAGQTPSDTNNIRSHVWTQSNNGMYEKMGSGSFRATQQAADSVGLPLGAPAETPEVSEESDTPNSGELFGAPKINGVEPLSF